jgi:GDP-mannose 4,6-dehydratase
LRILLTGATGTIGSQLIEELLARDETVYSLERYVSGRYSLDHNGNVRIVYGDLRDFSSIRRIIEEVQPEVVIHLAATTAVSYSYDHPHEVIETNLVGTVNLAEACLKLVPHLKQFAFASTSETYGNGPVPKTEETEQNPNSPYSVSKHAAEKYLLYMKDAYKFPITILRPFNTYGRKDNKHFVVERIITGMLSGSKVRLGDPDIVRDFLYIDDHVEAYIACIDNPKAIGRTFNFCTGKSISIKKLAERVAKLTNFKGQLLWHQTPSRPLDIKELVGSYNKAEQELGWTPKVDLETGLRLTVDQWKQKMGSANQPIRSK